MVEVLLHTSETCAAQCEPSVTIRGGKYQSCTNANAASSFGKLQSVGQTEGMKSCKHELDRVAGGTPFEEELQSCSPALPRGTRPAKTPYYHNDRG
jgi:hypothetical protein